MCAEERAACMLDTERAADAGAGGERGGLLLDKCSEGSAAGCSEGTPSCRGTSWIGSWLSIQNPGDGGTLA